MKFMKERFILLFSVVVVVLISIIKLSGTSSKAGGFEKSVEKIKPEAIYTVTSASDSGPGTLRDAIQQANNNPGLDTIEFNIPGSGPHVINLASALPDITDPVVIDGYTQPGSQPNSSCSGTATLRIVINGAGAGTGANGLTLAPGSGGSTIRGLVISNFDGSGIEVWTNNNVISGNYIGTNSSGNAAAGNGVGIFIMGNSNTIGGVNPAHRNLISGNASDGLVVFGSNNNAIQGNYIGTNASGNSSIPNSADGVFVLGSSNTIGGSSTTLGCSPGNLISGNVGDGISIIGSSTNNLVQGNLIGTNASGMSAIPNGSQGIYITGSNTTVGGLTPDLRNLLSGNGGDGVNIGGGSSNTVIGNYIGTNLAGNSSIGNKNGVSVDNNSSGNTISNNLISGNEVGIEINEGNNNTIQANLIGTQANGTSPLGNSEAGIYIHQPTSTGNLVGGTLSGQGNVIMFNGNGTLIPGRFGEGGIIIFAGATGNRVYRNSINNNAGLGIDLGSLNANGVTANDPLDVDSGDGNNYQNFPQLTSAISSGSLTVIQGLLLSTPNRSFRIEFFSVPTADPSGNGEGAVFLGATNVTTNAAGAATINFNASVGVTVGHFVTATATDLTTGDTSEFSAAQQVQAPTSAGVTVAGRVMNQKGFGIRGVRVILVDQNGAMRISITNAFGYYSFADVEAGQVYVIEAVSKRYNFRAQVITVNEDMQVNFIAED
ncbi:MAG: right-handed parallel beta-helix repeat-containing protein [Pyrinomonadaceae bacterium]|nr:right-handed parallel beta-helix repeat-containing protein [Pyrinomonadaceae bacterium]